MMVVIDALGTVLAMINLVFTLLIMIVGFVYFSRNRFLWCRCGKPHLWESDPFGPCTSQHLLDPYSTAHAAHGFLFVGFLHLFVESHVLVVTLAIFLELAWELFENSAYVINRYRASSISADYQGDSLLNSFGDILCCATGAVIAVNLPYLLIWGAFFSLELTNALWIRSSNLIDLVSLTLNPRWLERWQSRGKQEV